MQRVMLQRRVVVSRLNISPRGSSCVSGRGKTLRWHSTASLLSESRPSISREQSRRSNPICPVQPSRLRRNEFRFNGLQPHPGGTQVERKKASDFSQELLNLFDGYVH